MGVMVVTMTMTTTMNGWSLLEVPSPEMRMIMLRMLVVVTWEFHGGGKDDNDDDDEQLVLTRGAVPWDDGSDIDGGNDYDAGGNDDGVDGYDDNDD